MIKMKKFLVAIAILSMLISGCAGDGTGTVGNGKIDAVEAATIQLAVGVIMNAHPEVVPIANIVSTELLEFIDGDSSTTVSMVDAFLVKKVDNLNLDVYAKASFMELVTLVKAEIANRIGKVEYTGKEMVIVSDFLKIVQSAARQRMVVK
jgi:hypothetical protein